MESVPNNRAFTFVNEDLTLAPVLLTVTGFIAIFTIYVTVKIIQKNRHKLETIHLFIINGLIGKVNCCYFRVKG